jgi:hypothetical protein
MPLMKPLSGVGEVDIHDENVERYEAGGWSKSGKSAGKSASATSKSTTSSSKSSSNK